MPLSSGLVQRHQLLQEQAYQAIRAAILSGELSAGERLVETQLAKKLQVSRTPIREALGQLQREDLISLDTNSVLRVAIFSLKDAIELYDCRLALEQLSVAEATKKATKEQLEQLKQLVESAAKPTMGNYEKLDLDYCFHRLLTECSGNLWLRLLLDQVFDKMRIIRMQTLKENPRVLNISVEHQQIYEAVSKRDIDGAIIAMTNHLQGAKARVVKQMEQGQ